MSLQHAILGFLSYRPMSGYDLKKRFDESVRNFWPATQSQIYRTLKAMVEDQWVWMEVDEQEDRPDRKVYHLTDDGLAELQRWLHSPPAIQDGRSAWLIQVFFAHHLSNVEIVALFEQRAAQLHGHLEYLRQQVQPNIPKRYEEFHSERLATLWQLTLDNGYDHLECELRWTEKAIERLRGLPKQ